MIDLCADGQVVGETASVLFSIPQPATVGWLVQLRNSGANTMTYRFQSTADGGATYVDMGASGSVFYNTLMPSQVVQLQVPGSNPIQLVGNASGGAFLDFSVTRFFNRSNGGPLPLIAL